MVQPWYSHGTAADVVQLSYIGGGVWVRVWVVLGLGLD